MADKKEKLSSHVTLRAVLLGLFFIPLNQYWLLMDFLWGREGPTTLTLFYNAVLSLLLLFILNLLLKKRCPKSAFSQGELLTIYLMICMASAVGGHDIKFSFPYCPMPFGSQPQKMSGRNYSWVISHDG